MRSGISGRGVPGICGARDPGTCLPPPQQLLLGDIADDPLAENHVSCLISLAIFPTAAMARKVLPSCLRQVDRTGVALQQVAGVRGNPFQDGRQVQGGGDLPPDLGNGGRLTGPALGFLLQAGFFDRHPHVGSQGGQQAHIVFRRTCLPAGCSAR